MPTSEPSACVLDTHAWIWAVHGDARRFGRAAWRVLQRAEIAVVPAVSLYEAANMVVRGRMELDRPLEPWMEDATTAPYAVAEITAEVAIAAAALEHEGFHGDPADRMVYATARVLDLPLLTADASIRAFDRSLPRSRGRRVVWG